MKYEGIEVLFSEKEVIKQLLKDNFIRKPVFLKINNDLEKVLETINLPLDFYAIRYLTDEGTYSRTDKEWLNDLPGQGILGIYPKLNSL